MITRCRLVLIALSIVCHCSLRATNAAADERDSAAKLFPGLTHTSIGVTRKGTPIEAFVSDEDFDLTIDKVRILVVGGLDGTSTSRSAVLAANNWFQSSARAKGLKDRYVLSVVPNANPDAANDQSNNGAGGDPTRSYPPQGDAYGSATDPEAAYLWRWIGMHAPDLVLVVNGGDRLAWSFPTSDDEQLKKLRQRFEGDDGAQLELSPATDSLAVALIKNSPSNTGTIPALNVTITADDQRDYFAKFMESLDQVKFAGPSPARRELQKRLDRTSIQVAEQLSRHYGHELGQVVYIPAVALIGRVKLGELTGDESHLVDVKKIVAPYVSGGKHTNPNSGSHLSGHLIFTELAGRTTGDERKRFIELARAVADLAFDENGNLKPSMPFHSEMSDALFMGGPILASVGRLTGEARYFDACARHIEFMQTLVLRDDSLYRHSPLDEAAWGRGNGFPALGLALCLSEFPDDHPARKKLLDAFRAHLEALAKHQDPTGCWHQVIDRPESYRELTATCMITFAMIRGVRRGWLDDKYHAPIERAWYSIRTRVAPDGGLVDVCTGTGKQNELRAYYDRTAILGQDARGGAMALLVATEMAAWESERAK